MGIQQMLLTESSIGVVDAITPWSAEDTSLSPGPAAEATIFINADGTFGADGDGISAGSPNWYNPTTGGIGSSYWARATPTSGTFGSGSGTGWVQLSTTRSWTNTRSTLGVKNTTFTLEIATDAAGTNIVSTSTGWFLSATYDA